MPSLPAESAAAISKMSRRRPPLLTCGSSISAMARKAYSKTQDLNGPIGSTTKRIARVAKSTFPLIHALQYQWLAVISFADDHILAIENAIENLFPRSTLLFDKIDEFVHTAETLPEKFEDAVNKFPAIIRRVPVLDWALACLMWWSKLLISALNYWGWNDVREKEIVVAGQFQSENTEEPSPIIHPSSIDSDGMKCSYKEILEKGTKESTEKREESYIKDKREAERGSERDENESNEGIPKETPIYIFPEPYEGTDT